ncbi:hypothetical protein EYF80_014522 [Liparis tanakae]|uniref:Uncharacterized protein n=1 Tax=Liparis tanakae TaxID=230148 RepID=A0A4Z2ICR5_9TELE|nr:hypothetical protein EYF80_014522 [Liparis tanakae]
MAIVHWPDLLPVKREKDQSARNRLQQLVRLIHDLRLDDLLDDVLQCDDAHHLIEGVSVTFAVHPVHHGQTGIRVKPLCIMSDMVQKSSVASEETM